MATSGWIGVDLDGTLAHYEGWLGISVIGEPIPAMIARVKAWLADGVKVKIFTARVCSFGDPELDDEARGAIQEWCRLHVGEVLEVTNVKDFAMIELWDDRAVRVQMNTGEPCCNYSKS